MLRRLVAIMAYWLIRGLTRLWRYRYVDRHHSVLALEDGRPILYAFYHGQQLMLFGHKVPRPMVQMVSRSRDGQLQHEILTLLGFSTVRGSPGKDGMQALYEMAGLVVESGYHAALAVDGSRGPRRIVKDGILQLARDTSGAIIPLTAAASHVLVLKSTWDHYTIAWPLAKVVVVEGEPLFVSEDTDDDGLERLRLELEERLIAQDARTRKLATRTHEPQYAALPPDETGETDTETDDERTDE